MGGTPSSSPALSLSSAHVSMFRFLCLHVGKRVGARPILIHECPSEHIRVRERVSVPRQQWLLCLVGPCSITTTSICLFKCHVARGFGWSRGVMPLLREGACGV
jgi:hypothetical protein